jgi:Predicted SAM-dependent methyltransferase
MKISKRLRFIINEIENDSIVDIGTDHAYVPIAAMLKGKIKKAIACDIKNGPLEIAKKNIVAHGFQNQIKTRISNGFDNILIGEANTAVISGMGGFIICDILNRAKNILPFFEQLIIQPQNNIYYVRKLLHANGFAIKNEIFLYQQNFYNIINAHREKDILYDEKDYAVGKILLQNNDTLLKKFLLLQTQKLLHIKNYNKEADKFYKLYMEALECFVQK